VENLKTSSLRNKAQTHKQRSSGFRCINCRALIPDANRVIGTQHRDHCPLCLFSLHLDEDKPGDRKSRCFGAMRPIGMTFKNNCKEPMVVYECVKCGKIHKNRCSADDSVHTIVDILRRSLVSGRFDSHLIQKKLQSAGVILIGKEEVVDLLHSIFGIAHIPQKYVQEFEITL